VPHLPPQDREWKEDLQRNFAVKVFVIGAVRHSHTTAAYLTFDSVVAKNSADERIWSGSDGDHGKPFLRES